MISIVIPVLNEASKIVPFLQHLQPFREAGHELILVDGGSHDGTPDLSEDLVDQLILTDAGRAHQMNQGAALAKGDLLLFQHVDTWLPDEAVTLLSSLQGESLWGRFDVRLTPGHWLFPVIARLMNFRSRLTGIATGDQSIFVSRELFAKAGGFPDQQLMEDVELSGRLKRYADPLCLREHVLTSSRRWRHKGVWKTIFLMWRLRLAYFLGRSPEQLTAIYYPQLKSARNKTQ